MEKKDKKILRYCVECGQEIQDWEAMMDAGYAQAEETDKLKYFRLTRVGLDWLGEKIGATIYNESD